MTAERDRGYVLRPRDAGQGRRETENRALSSTPAMPTTRCGGNPVALRHQMRHFFERIGHHDDDAGRRVLADGLGDSPR